MKSNEILVLAPASISPLNGHVLNSIIMKKEDRGGHLGVCHIISLPH